MRWSHRGICAVIGLDCVVLEVKGLLRLLRLLWHRVVTGMVDRGLRWRLLGMRVICMWRCGHILREEYVRLWLS